MSRIRTIKPDFFRHETLFDAEVEERLPLRVAFISLWTIADREGRFKWRPRSLKSDCLPFDNVDFSRVLDALATRGFVVKYEVDGEFYGCIPTFTKHQVINNREAASNIPAPSKVNKLSTRAGRVRDASSTPLKKDQGEGKGREGEREGNLSDPNGSGAEAPKEGMDEDPKKVLFSAGLKWLSEATGKPEKTLRPLVGRMLSDIGGDTHAGALLGIFRDARRERKADPISWIQAMIKGRGARAGPTSQKSNGNEGFIRSVLEDIENDTERDTEFDFSSEKGSSGAVPMLQLQRDRN